MASVLEFEVASEQVSPSFYAWMLGRLLLASCQSRDELRAVAFEKRLVEVLDGIATKRADGDAEKIELVDDPLEAWAWAYLLMHYGDAEARPFPQWLKASRLVWASTERAAGLVHARSQDGSRMWVNVLSVLAFSTQHNSGTVLASTDPLARQAVLELFDDTQQLFCFKAPDATAEQRSAIDMDQIAEYQMSAASALRQIPTSDLRAWAVGLTRLAMSQAPSASSLDADGLDDVFVEAMRQAEVPGDKALGAANWLYAEYLLIWRGALVKALKLEQ